MGEYNTLTNDTHMATGDKAFKDMMDGILKAPLPTDEPPFAFDKLADDEDFAEFDKAVLGAMDLLLQVTPPLLEDYKAQINYEVQHADNADLLLYWLNRRTRIERNEAQAKPIKISLHEAINCLDRLTAEPSQPRTSSIIEGAETPDTSTPRARSLLDAIYALSAQVWHDVDTGPLHEQLQQALYDPQQKVNICEGARAAKLVAQQIIDHAYACKVAYLDPGQSRW